MTLQIRPAATAVQPATTPTSLEEHEHHSAVDKGIDPPTGEVEERRTTVMDTLRENHGEASLGQLAAMLADDDSAPDQVRSAVPRLENTGRVTVAEDGGQILRIL